MKRNRSTFVLIGLFFTSLLGLWWLESAGVQTDAQRRMKEQRVLPQLMDVREAAVSRLEIVREGQTLAFERRGNSRWQLVQPLDVGADPAAVETLVRNIMDLRRSPDTGTISGASGAYGLDPPSHVVRLRGGGGSQPDDRPLAVLEVGKTIRELTYVRPSGTTEVEVVEGKLLAAIDRPISDWREVNLMPLPTFQVSGVAITREGLKVNAERGAGGQWRLASPIAAPANGPKIESLLAALSSIRVLDGSQGFVADNVQDFTPYGLDKPEATVELGAASQAGGPLVLHVGKKAPGQPDRVFVRRGDQDDVVVVSARFLSEIPRDSKMFRGQSVTEVNPAAVRQIEVATENMKFLLDRQRDGWKLRSPREEKADTYLVQSFLNQLEGLKSSEFLDPGRVIQPGLDPPVMTIRVWQFEGSTDGKMPDGKGLGGASPEIALRPPMLVLRIGRHDRLRKTIYGRLEGDDVILALPDSLLESLPRSQYAFRDRAVLAASPATVSKLTLARQGAVTVLEPDRTASAPNHWKMLAPVKAQADVRAVTQLLSVLSDLRVEDFVGDIADAKIFGLDPPSMTLAWETDPPALVPAPGETVKGSAGPPPPPPRASGSLSLGKPVPGKPGAFYASLGGQPFVFIMAATVVQAVAAEFHDAQVFSLPAEAVRRLVFRTAGRTLAFVRRSRPGGGPSDWSPEPGTDMRGIDLSRFNDLVTHIAQLRTPRFFQYEGPIPEAAGLSRPRLEIELDNTDGKLVQTLRLGHGEQGLVLAATGKGSTGAVFGLPAAAWDALIDSIAGGGELPDQPFAP